MPLSEHLGRAWTLLAAMDVTGLVAVKVQELSCKAGSYLPRALNRALWLQLFQERILPLLQPFDGRRLPRSVVVIDNASLHWGNDEDDEDEALVFVNQLDELIRSHYTVVQLAADKSLTAEPFASYFSNPKRGCVAPILARFDDWIANCKAAAKTTANEKVGSFETLLFWR